MSGILGQHSLVDRSLRLVAGTIDQEGIELLARYGITIRDARKIKKLVDDGTIQTSDTGQIVSSKYRNLGRSKISKKVSWCISYNDKKYYY